jgi:hypothetical protein
MKKQVITAATLAFCCAFGLSAVAQRAGRPAAGAAAPLYDWATDGGDGQRTGWNKDEKILTKSNIKDLTLLWKMETGNQVRALHALMPVLVIGRLNTTAGAKQVGFVSGISDNLYAFDVESGTMLWKKHWDYTPPAGRGGGGGPPPGSGSVLGGPNTAAAPRTTCAAPLAPGTTPQPPSQDPANLGFLGPGGSSDVPVIAPADPQGRRPLYFVTGDGMLRTIDAATGEEIAPAFCFAPGKGWALNLFHDMIWMPHGGSISATLLDDPKHNVMTFDAGSGGMWGRRGAALDSTGTAWSTTGDGTYNPETFQFGNSLAGVSVDNGRMQMKDYFTPRNWDWLRKRDLDPNNTPTIFTYKGRELLAASGKECRVYLIDPKFAGGDDHMTPLYKTPLFCNEEVDFQDMGSWGALSTWQDAAGTRWVLAPFWGPVHSQFKAPIMNTPIPKDGGVAAFTVVEVAGKTQLAPAWVSRDMQRGEPVIIANGMVFGYGSGEETKQSFPDIGLQFASKIRASKSGHATIYVMDAQTGKELWSSGEQITSFNHFSGIAVANGRVYLGTYDGTLWCFGVK